MPTLKKFCDLRKYVEQNNKALYEAMEDLCLLGLINTGRGRRVTFVMPDKKTTSDITKEAYGMDPEKAIDIIKSHVLMGCYAKTADFNAKKDDIPNGHRKKVEVDKVDSSTVTLKNGAVLKLDDKFKVIGDRENMAVYDLTKGSMPKGEKDADYKYLKSDGKSKASKDDPKAVGGNEGVRRKINTYIGSMLKDPSSSRYNPFLECVCRMLMCLEKEDEKSFKCALAVLDANPVVSYFILTDPYGKFGKVIVESSMQQRAKSAEYMCPNPVTTFKKYLSQGAKMFSGLASVVDKCREELFSKDCNKIQLSTAIKREYNAFCSNENLPEALKTLYGGNSDLKIMHDTARFLIDDYLSDLEANPYASKGEYLEAFKAIETSKMNILTNSRLFTNTQSAAMWFSGPFNFIRSTCFLYFTMDGSESYGKDPSSTDIPYNLQVTVNYHKQRVNRLSTYSDEGEFKKQDILSAVEHLLKAKDSEMLRVVQQYQSQPAQASQ